MKWMKVLKLWHSHWSGGQVVQEGKLIAAWESRRKCTLLTGQRCEKQGPQVFVLPLILSGTRHHPTLFKQLQHTSANTDSVLLSGSGTHWHVVSNQATKRLLSLPFEEEVVAELVVVNGKGHGLKTSLNEKTRWTQSCSGTWSVTSFFYIGNS